MVSIRDWVGFHMLFFYTAGGDIAESKMANIKAVVSLVSPGGFATELQ